MMQTDAYQDFVYLLTLPTANNEEYGVYNLCAEAGEVASLFAKAKRDGADPQEFIAKLTKELGDVQFMVTHLCNQFGLDLGEVMDANFDKLMDRRERQALQGAGDDR